MKEEAKKRFIDFAFPILMDFVVFFGIPTAVRQLFGKKAKPEDIEHLRKASEHLQRGEAEAARDEFKKIKFPELTLADEQIFLADILRAVRQVSCTQAEADNLLNYLAGLDEKIRDRFRASHVNEPDEAIRSVQLAQLAKLNDDQRNAFLKGTGLFDPTPLEKAQKQVTDKINALDAAAAPQVTILQADIAASWKRVADNLKPPATPAPTTGSTKAKLWRKLWG